MRFHCLLPCRDEADIIEQCLKKLLIWADNIFVYDTGSVDATWDIVRDMSANEPRVIPLKQEHVYFSENKLRGWMFNHAREQMEHGDWFLRVDADEFHHITPPEFVKTRLRKHETIVYHQYYNFVLLASEVLAWESGSESLSDRLRPIEERRRWYIPSTYAEPRLCQYRKTMRWPSTVSFPYNAGYVARERIPIRHYPHRDPYQLDRRCRLRAAMMNDKDLAKWTNPESFHWAEAEWRKFITADEDKNLHYWAPDEELQEVRQFTHLARFRKRVAQRFLHQFMLPFFDRVRSPWQDSDIPQRMPQEIIDSLKKTLAT